MRTIRLTILCLFGLALAQCLLAPDVRADVIIAPLTASSDVPALFSPGAPATINQDGLSSNYVPGVTDFDVFTATTTALGTVASIYIPEPADHFSTLTYDFGAIVSIASIAVWNNRRSNTEGVDAISGFDLFADDDSNIANGTTASLGSFSMGPAFSFVPAPAEVFSFAPTSTQFVHFVITGTLAGRRTGINEVAFEANVAAQEVPEPISVALWSLMSVAGLAAWRRRRTQATAA